MEAFGRDGVSNHQPHDCLINRLFRHRSKKTPKLRVIGLCVGNSPGTGEFPAQMASDAENVSIWWRHHAISNYIEGDERVVTDINHVSFSDGLAKLYDISFKPFEFNIYNYFSPLFDIDPDVKV